MKLETTNGVTEVKAVPMTGPIPSDHVHMYSLDTQQWKTTVPDHQYLDTSISKMSVGRMNHGCASYNSGGWKIMVAGGVRQTGSGNDHTLG